METNKLDYYIELIGSDILEELKFSEKKSRNYIKKRSKQLLVYILKNKRYFIEDKRFFWINGLFAWGLCGGIGKNNCPDFENELDYFYSRILPKVNKDYYLFMVPDHFIHAEVLTHLNKEDAEEYINLAKERALSCINDSKHDVFLYRGANSDFYIDGFCFSSLFFSSYYLKYGDETIKEACDKQLKFILNNCIDGTNGMPYHAFNLKNMCPVGVSTWGRGLGWFLLGLTSVMQISCTDEYVRKYKEVVDYMYSFMKDGYIPEDMNGTHIDTSPTAILAYCCYLGIREGWLGKEYREKVVENIKALIVSTDKNGKVNDCSGECGGVDSYSKEYGNFYSQGFFYRLLCEMKHDEENYYFDKCFK